LHYKIKDKNMQNIYVTIGVDEDSAENTIHPDLDQAKKSFEEIVKIKK
jgi:hypothetical protein